MTGQKDRYSTTEKLWNLDDKQLTTPKHDELVLMLLDKEYIKNKIVKDNLKSEILNIFIEKPLVNNNGFYIGYIDVCVEAELSIPKTQVRCPHCNELPFRDTLKTVRQIMQTPKNHTCPKCNKEFKIKEELLVPCEDDTNQITYYIECKPKVTSFGETIRQLNTYIDFVNRSSCKTNEFVLFTPDTTFIKAFESQNIRVVLP